MTKCFYWSELDSFVDNVNCIITYSHQVSNHKKKTQLFAKQKL